MHFVRCFQDKSHPLSTAVGNAQYNFYNRIVPLNKKVNVFHFKFTNLSFHHLLIREILLYTFVMGRLITYSRLCPNHWPVLYLIWKISTTYSYSIKYFIKSFFFHSSLEDNNKNTVELHLSCPILQIYMASTKEEKVALLPGIQTEVEAITSDVSEFVSNLNVVLHRLYPIFDCEVVFSSFASFLFEGAG